MLHPPAAQIRPNLLARDSSKYFNRLLIENVHYLLPLAFLSVVLSADGEIIATEPFDYGANNQPLVGRAGGSGFTGAWAAVSSPTAFTYTPSGLNFSDLPVAGGAVSSVSPVGSTTVGNVNRRFTAPLSGAVWGSFLVRLATRPTNVPVQSFIIGNASDTDVTGTMPFQSDEYAQGPGAIRMENASVLLSGSPLATGETYLFLFKAEFAATQRATAWILSAPQFDTFKTNGLTEAELDLAAVGNGAGNITERGANMRTGALGPTDYMHWLSYSDSTTQNIFLR